MQQYKKILGKVMMTAEGTYDSNKEYDPISLITDEETGKSYISRKEVPAGTQINNREYWQPVASSGIIDNGVIILNRKNSDGQVPIYDLKSAAEAVAVGDRKGGVILGFLGFNPETDTVPTWKLYQYNDVSPSNWTNIDYWLPMDYTNKYAGWFDNEEALYDSVPFPKVGMYAYVGNSASSAVVYRCYNDRVWQPTEDKAFSGVVNLADEEDITSKQNKLKFKDKEYNPAQFSGLGKLYLRKNIVDGKNILTQTMVQATNTIYIIQYDYDLQGEIITIPENCVLQFEGGSFSNGSIVGNKTIFLAYPEYSIFNDCFVKGFRWQHIDIRWFGAKEGEDCSDALQRAVNTYNTMILTPIKIIGEYRLDKTVKADNGIIINNNVTNSYFRDDRLYEGDAVLPIGKLIVENAITCIDIDRSNILNPSEPAQEAVISIVGLYVVNEVKNATFVRYRCGGWPSKNFIIKHNVFEGFDRVLYFAGGQTKANSQAFGMEIDHTRFIGSNYAIYAVPENPNVADSSFTNMVISSCQIDNGSKLYIKGLYGANTIKDTSVQGTTIEGEQIETPIIYLGIRTGNLTFENMYLENIDGYIYIEGTNKTFTSFYSEVNFRGNYYAWDSYANPKLKYYFKDIRISSIHYNLPNKNLILENVSIDSDNLERTGYNAMANSNITIDGVENNSILLTGNNYKVVGLDEYNFSSDGGKNLLSGAFKKSSSDSTISYANSITGYKFTENAEIELNYISVVGENILDAGDYIFNFYKGDGLLTVDLYDGDALILSKTSQFAHGVYLFKVNLEQPISNPIIKVKHNSVFVTFSFMTPIGVIPIFTRNIESQYLSNFNIVLGNNTKYGGIRYGSYSTMPNFSNNVTIASYFDNYHRKPAWFYGGKWRFADGMSPDTVYSGAFSSKPDLPPRGFAYFCTNKQTVEGGVNGIVIYHKGDNIWVDALGRVVE